jgi:hypothetical protein
MIAFILVVLALWIAASVTLALVIGESIKLRDGRG